MISDTRKAPFPWFGGKRHAAPQVWDALGDVAHYVEPFAGTMAVLLNRPHPPNRTYYSETVNDKDGLLINFWRSVKHNPRSVAEHASWPVTEADKTARSCAVLDAGRRLDLERLMGDPGWHDPQIAGWWVWCVCVTIGAFGGGGPWWPDVDGRIRKWAPGEPRPAMRDNPLLAGYDMPDGGDTTAPGVPRGVPHLSDGGKGVARPQLRDDDAPDMFTMPDLAAWIHALAARLRHVRIINGDWKRALGNGVALTLSVRQSKTPVGVFLDPPYSTGDTVYRDGLGGRDVQTDVADWAIKKGDDPRWRLVACGYTADPTHDLYVAAGWTVAEWFQQGHLRGGYGDAAHTDRLYLSPHCLRPDPGQPTLFDDEAQPGED